LENPRLSKLELEIMETLWSAGALSIRDIQEALPAGKRPAYTTVQTMVYRLEEKGALKRIDKVSNAHIFDALITRNETRGRLIDEFLGLFGGRTQPVMAHLVETGKLTMEDVKQAEQLITEMRKTKKREERS
jgi:BlaI family penicillinase repressor